MSLLRLRQQFQASAVQSSFGGKVRSAVTIDNEKTEITICSAFLDADKIYTWSLDHGEEDQPRRELGFFSYSDPRCIASALKGLTNLSEAGDDSAHIAERALKTFQDDIRKFNVKLDR